MCDNEIIESFTTRICDDFSQQWLKRYESRVLDIKDFRIHWSQKVPEFYSPTNDCNCLNINFNEIESKKQLIQPLERFMTGVRSPETLFSKLKQTDDPPTLCGRVFKSGEPTYSCRDCGLDPTCVLCVECFRNSAHKNHRYKMSTSGGGSGFCDCGDKEAWKSYPFCDIHVQGVNSAESENSDPLKRITPELEPVIDRTRLVFRAVLGYCFEILTWNQCTQLPPDLQCNDYSSAEKDTFVTMLFNDEVHTYEQVINTLNRAIDCNSKEAIEYATNVDREGRSIIKCSQFNPCSAVKALIEKITSRNGGKTLRVEVMHTSLVAHQIFATRLLNWLREILSHCEVFRYILAEVLMTKDMAEDEGTANCDSPLLERIMRADTQLWKSMRNQWHQLFISGLLMESKSKKEFAKIFTRSYGLLMKEFILDDHDHSLSITSLSVQLFTVPSLAHALIAEEDAIVVLLQTFLTECVRHRRNDGKLAFERNHSAISGFRRAQYILYDLKYILAVKPVEWVSNLRTNFLSGVEALLGMLKWMQGMDAVTRQVGQHVEFEAEWETGVNLQLKLAPIVALIIEWCASDKTTLVKALRYTLKEMSDFLTHCRTLEWELLGYRASTLEYDVATEPVSIHLPFTRLVAGLLLQLGKYDISYDDPLLIGKIGKKPTPVQLIELPLRTQVMIAQFRAGMWRRNGYSLVNQVYFYHNVRLRDEMYDRDILMLQIGAAHCESNEFLIHILNKFSLVFWSRDNYERPNRKPEEDYVRQTISLVEEFLGLLLTIISERHVPGVGNVTLEERVKKEIIQWLSMEPMTHSELVKYLPRETNSYDFSIENVINEVANFRRPTPSSTTGKYELKEEFFKDFNPFFYHYSRQDQSCAEEMQIKRKKQNGEELICCPPPIPLDLDPHFCNISALIQCDMMVHIITTVLKRTCNLHAISFSETQFEKVLHIIGVGLHEQSKATIPDFNFAEKCVNQNIISLLEQCSNRPIISRIEIHKDLLKWVLRKFNQVLHTSETVFAEKMEQTLTTDESNSSSKTKHDGKRNPEIAAARRRRIMAQMSAMQKNFIKEHPDLFKDIDTGVSGSDSLMDLSCIPSTPVEPIAVGENQRGKFVSIEKHTCILCREEQEVSITGRCLVLSAFIQRSTVLSKNRDRKLWNDSENIDPLFISSDLYFGPHISTCGHVMHSDCWQKFFDSVLAKERRRPIRYGRHVSFDVDKHEFLCPLCECLSNSVIPIIPALNTESKCSENKSDISLSNWLFGLRAVVEKSNPTWVKDPTMNAETGEKFVCRFLPDLKEILINVPLETKESLQKLFEEYHENRVDNEELSASLIDVMKNFSLSVYMTSLGVNPNPDDDRVSLISYWACSYTLHMIEKMIRVEDKPIFVDLSNRKYNCLKAMVRFIGSSIAVFSDSVIKSHCIRILRYLLVNDYHIQNSKCILDLDPLSLLITLVITTPSLYLFDSETVSNTKLHSMPLGNISDKHYINLLMMFHMIQIILTKKFTVIDEPMETDESQNSERDNSTLQSFYSDVIRASGITSCQTPDSSQIELFFKSNLLPFVRSISLFFHFLTNVTPPQQLKDSPTHLLNAIEEYAILSQYLGLNPNLSALVENPCIRNLALIWSRHPRVGLICAEKQENISPMEFPLKLIAQPHSLNTLIDLPNDYSELINSVSQFTCPNSDGDDSRSPTMCLVCGTILCSQSYCCQKDLDGTMVGSCTWHSHYCGAGIGIFLRIRDCKILLLAGRTKGCYLAPPYIDEYGETDQGLIRGNPLHLSHSSYAELQKLWLRHGIPEQIAHALEISSNLATTSWHLL